MSLSRVIFFVAGWLLCAGETRAGAEAWPVRGAVAGELKVEALAELGLGWTVEATAEGMVVRAGRAGVEVEVLARPGEGGAWRWAVRKGEVDLAELWPLVRASLGEAAAGWSASGRVVIAGEGAWSAEAGPTGEVRVELRDGWARSDELDVEVSGMELRAATRDLAGGNFGPGQTLRIAKVAAAGVAVTGVELDFGGGAEAVAVERLEAAVLGGRFRAKPFKVAMANPVVDAAAEVEGLSLREMAALMPWAVAAAEGRLQGRIKLGWDAAKGLRIRDGGLAIVKTDAAEFRLAPAPGFLTGSMPRRLLFLPPWLGKWTQKVGPVNPAYGPLSDIEMGRTGMKIESLAVEFRPDGTLGARSATVKVLARPTNGEFVEELTLEMNLFGPLADALALGMDERVKLKFR